MKPAPAPCGSCPYRRDVPSGVWSAEEYEKLPCFDGATHEQPMWVFMCHQQDGRLCAGWVGCHDMSENLGLRLTAGLGLLTPEDLEAVLAYETAVPLFDSGAEAAAHGLAALEQPDERAIRQIEKLRRKRAP
jgi:Family of unknown function (DUF6283)